MLQAPYDQPEAALNLMKYWLSHVDPDVDWKPFDKAAGAQSVLGSDL